MLASNATAATTRATRDDGGNARSGPGDAGSRMRNQASRLSYPDAPLGRNASAIPWHRLAIAMREKEQAEARPRRLFFICLRPRRSDQTNADSPCALAYSPPGMMDTGAGQQAVPGSVSCWFQRGCGSKPRDSGTFLFVQTGRVRVVDLGGVGSRMITEHESWRDAQTCGLPTRAVVSSRSAEHELRDCSNSSAGVGWSGSPPRHCGTCSWHRRAAAGDREGSQRALGGGGAS
jgi:hypothetical protein